MNIKHLKNPPIIEAILDIDCDMPGDFKVSACIDSTMQIYQDRYPKLRKRYLHQHEFRVAERDQPATPADATVNLQGLLLADGERKQLVQVRQGGFSFNRLQPYTTLDDYLPEIERTWGLFADHFHPVQIQRVKLRYVNRISIPLDSEEKASLDDYFTVGPRLPGDNALEFVSFLQHHQVVERETGNMGKIVLASQAVSDGRLPVVFDIEVMRPTPSETDWSGIKSTLIALRSLKNQIFHNSLTPLCIEIFEQV